MKTGLILTGALMILSAISCKKEKVVHKGTSSGVTGSEWFSPVSASANLWEELILTAGGKYFRTEMMAPELSTTDIDNSVILVYGKLTGYDSDERAETEIGLLPTTIYRKKVVPSADEWNIGISAGRISIRYQNTQSYYPGSKPHGGHSFRYIIIPKYAPVTGQKPNSINPLSKYSESELRSLSYDEICETAGIRK